MKDYSLDRDSRKNYIVNMYVAENKTLTVVFADGTRFENIANTQENVDKIAAIQEAQARKAVANYPTFRRKERVAFGTFIGSVLTTYGIGWALQSTELSHNPVLSIVTGAAVVGAVALPAAIHFCHSATKMSELEKIKYRDEHRDTLEQFRYYPNSLMGVSNKRHFAFSRSQNVDAFSVLDIDNFTKDDLETIVTNVEREKQYTLHEKNFFIRLEKRMVITRLVA